MSKFSGQYDFCDLCAIHGIEYILKSNIYIGRNCVPLKIESEKDLIPYYSRLVYLAGANKESGNFWLTDESCVDTKLINPDMDLNGIHYDISDYYRANLYDKMVQAGWSEDEARRWVYREVK